MAPNIKPATAFLALLSADARSLTDAEHSRRVEPLGGSASENAKQDIGRLVRNVDAEFTAGSDGEGGASDSMVTKQLGGGGGVRSLSGNARERFVQQPRIQRLLEDIKRKRELTGTVKRGINEQKDDTSLVECSLDVELLEGGEFDGAEKDIEDVGLLGKCDHGYACVASEASKRFVLPCLRRCI